MRRKRKRSALGQFPRDVAGFAAGSMVTGAAAKMVAPYGAPYTAGIAQVGAGLPAIGALVPLKTQVGMLSEATRQFKPKRKKRKRY